MLAVGAYGVEQKDQCSVFTVSSIKEMLTNLRDLSKEEGWLQEAGSPGPPLELHRAQP